MTALAVAMPAAAVESDTIEQFWLKNGMEVIVIPNHRVPAVSHMLWFRIGAADDPNGKSGLAHFHEHLMFQGTKAHKAGEYADIIARHGGQQNAFTGHDATSYYVNIAKEELPMVMALEADRMRGLKPLDKDVAREKEVIIEERRMRIENNPAALFAEQMDAALYRNHPYHFPVIGWMHEMEGLNKQDVLDFHTRYYHPNNGILIVSGDITASELKPLAEKYYGALPKKPVSERVWKEEPPHIAARRLEMHHANVQQPQWTRVYAASSLAYGKKEQALPNFLLSQLLGGGKTSRLYQALVVEQKLASAVDTDYNGFTRGPAEFTLTVIPEKNIAMPVLEAAIDKQLQRISRDGVMPEELTRAKNLLKAESIYARDGLSGMARIMGWIRIIGLDTGYFSRWPELIDAVSAGQVQQAALELFRPERSVTGVLLPPEEAPK